VIVKCPQCGSDFDKDANEFCPTPGCGYPSAFIVTPEAEGPEPEDMLRRPGEQATAPQPVVPLPPEPIPAVPAPRPVAPQPTVPAEPVPSGPPPRRRSTGFFIAIGFLVGLVIIGVVIFLLTRSGDGGGDGSTSGPTTPDCTTEVFQGSLGDRVLGLCPEAMRGNDVRELQQRLNVVLVGTRVLVVDGSFGPKTATAVHDYQVCRDISPANSIVDGRTADAILADSDRDACATGLRDIGPPKTPGPGPSTPGTTTAPSTSSPSPSPSPTDTLQSPTTT
jgi:hypothetical protein